jgi:hypothetical protein
MCRCCFKNHFSSEQSKRHGHVGRMILIGLFVLSATIMSLSYIAYGKLSGALESFSESVEKLGDVFWTMEEASLGACSLLFALCSLLLALCSFILISVPSLLFGPILSTPLLPLLALHSITPSTPSLYAS